jgi:phosphohistidine phosphatase
MRRLLLFRHAKSSRPAGVDDHDRPLSGRGRCASEAMGRFMVEQGLRPDLVVVSSSRRTHATWALASLAFGQHPPAVDDDRLYEATPETLLEVIRQTQNAVQTLMLVGHNPGMAELADLLVARGKASALSRMREKFPTATLAVIDFEATDWAELSPGSGRLESFNTPKTLGGG